MITTDEIKDLQDVTFHRYSEYVSIHGSGSSLSCFDDPVYSFDGIHAGTFYREHPGDTGEIRDFSYGCLSAGVNIKKDVDISDLLITPDLMGGSDYSGTTVQLSNYEVFKEKYGDNPGVYTAYGGYGTFAIVISVKWLLNPANEEIAREIIDCLNGLSDYPLMDDEKLSNMEMDKESEYVNSDGIFELNREFMKQYGLDVSEMTGDQCWELYRELMERSNTYPVFESNGWPYIDWERIVKAYRIGDLTRLDIKHELMEAD